MRFFNTIYISAILTALLFTLVGTVLAADDWCEDTSQTGPYGETVYTYLGGDFGGILYNYAYFNAIRNNGTAEYIDYLWFWIIVDGEEIEWYTSGPEWDEESEVECEYYMFFEAMSYFDAPGKEPWNRIAFCYLPC